MKPLRLFAVIFLILSAAAAYRHVQSSLKPADTTIDWRLLQQVVPQATSFRRLETGLPVYEALGPFKEPTGFAFYTRDFVKDIHGYGGPIEMVVGINQNGTITGIKVTRQQETPAFTADLSSFLNRIIGKSIQTPLVLGKDLDGITSATITSSAIISTINTAAQKISSQTAMPGAGPSGKDLRPAQNNILRLCIALLFLLSLWACTARKKVIRWTALVLGFLFMGIFLREMLSTAHIAGIILLEAPGGNPNLWFSLLIGSVITCLMLGRSYCVGVCPFGFIEEALFTLNQKLFHWDMCPDKKTDHNCRWIKYILLILVLAVCIFYQQSGLGAIEVYITLFTGKGSAPAWTLLACVLLGSFFFLRFWCRYLCPFGAFLGLISQFRIQKPKKHSVLEAISPASLCAMPSECFYCDRCSVNTFNSSTPRKNTFFVFLIVLSCLLFAASFGKTVFDTHFASKPVEQDVEQTPQEKNLAAARIETYSKDSESAKEKLREAGITPRPAKYWKLMNDE